METAGIQSYKLQQSKGTTCACTSARGLYVIVQHSFLLFSSRDDQQARLGRRRVADDEETLQRKHAVAHFITTSAYTSTPR